MGEILVGYGFTNGICPGLQRVLTPRGLEYDALPLDLTKAVTGFMRKGLLR